MVEWINKQKRGWRKGWWDSMLGNEDWSLTSAAFLNILRKSKEEDNRERGNVLAEHHK